MHQEENIIFQEKKYEENEIQLEIFNFPSNKSEPFLSIKTNIFNVNEIENITLEEMTKIMNGPTVELEEEDSESIYFTKNSKNDLQLTDATTKFQSISSISDNKNETCTKNISFTTILRKKRGRKVSLESKKNRKFHCSDDFDNIQRKIQVHFISFLVNFANDILKAIFGPKTKFNFKHVDYELKKIVSHIYTESLKKSNYSDIMKLKISPKNKNFSENSNKETFYQVCKNSDILKKIFDKKYLYVFQKYYCKVNNNDTLDLEGLKITLSPKTRTLHYLLEKNGAIKEKFKSVVNDVYFSEFNYNSNSNNKFFISSFS